MNHKELRAYKRKMGNRLRREEVRMVALEKQYEDMVEVGYIIEAQPIRERINKKLWILDELAKEAMGVR